MSDKLKNYAEAVAAFAEGKPIEVCSSKTGLWSAVPQEAYLKTEPPTFHVWKDFRIAKPKLRYRVALLSGSNGNRLATAYDDFGTYSVETRPNFIRWVTDWEYVDSSS